MSWSPNIPPLDLSKFKPLAVSSSGLRVFGDRYMPRRGCLDLTADAIICSVEIAGRCAAAFGAVDRMLNQAVAVVGRGA